MIINSRVNQTVDRWRLLKCFFSRGRLFRVCFGSKRSRSMNATIEDLKTWSSSRDRFWIQTQGPPYPCIHDVKEEPWVLDVQWDRSEQIGGKTGICNRQVTKNISGITGYVKWYKAFNGRPVLESFKIHVCNLTDCPCRQDLSKGWKAEETLHVLIVDPPADAPMQPFPLADASGAGMATSSRRVVGLVLR